MSSFAEKMMKKQGWKEGQGLGKDQQGISKAIKPSLKFDTAGIGHDQAKEFTNNWWDLAYKKAANKIEVTETSDQVEVKSKKRKRKKEAKEAKNRLYSSFTKSATLENGKILEEEKKSESDSSDDEFQSKVSAVMKLVSDEKLFKDVGVTAHKGARHGVTMQAKLKRVEQMDEKYLRDLKNK